MMQVCTFNNVVVFPLYLNVSEHCLHLTRSLTDDDSNTSQTIDFLLGPGIFQKHNHITRKS